VIGYTPRVIVSFRHKGLKLLYEQGDRRRLPPEYADKVERILARLDEATEPANMSLPGFRLHPLKGRLAGFWSVSVSGNWRIIFRFQGAHACDVDLVDYH
jgi:toxin HigB-1